MIRGIVQGQSLRLTTPQIVGASVDYLEAAFSFSSDWQGLSIWAHFRSAGVVYDVALEDGRIPAEKHLNLSAGTWDVYLHGTSGNKRITTSTVRIQVTPYPEGTGVPLPEVPLTAVEQIDQKATEAKSIADQLRKDAEAGKFTGPQGPQGLRGEQGPRGEPGIPGETGETGATGAPGADGKDGKDGITPLIGANGNWFLGEEDTGLPSRGVHGTSGKDGQDGITPTIGDNGNWYFNGVDSGKPSRGVTGAAGADGAPGKDGADGAPGAPGADGPVGKNGVNGITPHIGDNGNWYLGDEDTGKPSRGATGPAGADGTPGQDAPQDVVRYSEQTLTENQQQQARKNIGAFPSKVLRYFFDPTENSDHYNDTDIFDAPIGSMISPGNDYSKNGVSNEGMEFPVYVIDRYHITEQYEKVSLLDSLGKVWVVTLCSASPRTIMGIQGQHNEVLVANTTANNGTHSIDIDWDVLAKHIQGDGMVYLRVQNRDILPCVSVDFDQASGKALHAYFAAVYPMNDNLAYIMISYGSDGLSKPQVIPIPILPPLVCTFTQDSDGAVSASSSVVDIYNAWFKGCPVYATIQFRGCAAFHMVPLTAAEYNKDSNTYYLEFSGIRPASFGANMNVPVVHYDGTQWSMYLDSAVTASNIPTALKNPNALTIKVGDNTVSYDGSSAQEVKVPAADKSLGLTGATVGQIAKIAAVDASGVPTAWEPVDMASGGKAWTKIIDVEITEATMVFEATGLDNATELYCEWSGLKTASETNKRDLDLYINDIAVGGGWVTNATSNGNALFGYSLSIYNGFVWYNTKSAGIAGEANAQNVSMGNNAKVSYGLIHNVGAATKVKIKAVNADNAPVTGKLEVWAK